MWGTAMLVVTFLGSDGSFFFGWAKPVPIGPAQLQGPQRGMMLVGAAGPATNFVVARVAAGLVWLTYPWRLYAAQRDLDAAFALNVILGTLQPDPDPAAGRLAHRRRVPARPTVPAWAELDRYGNYVFLGLFVVMSPVPGVFDSTIGAVLDLFAKLLPGG